MRIFKRKYFKFITYNSCCSHICPDSLKFKSSCGRVISAHERVILFGQSYMGRSILISKDANLICQQLNGECSVRRCKLLSSHSFPPQQIPWKVPVLKTPFTVRHCPRRVNASQNCHLSREIDAHNIKPLLPVLMLSFEFNSVNECFENSGHHLCYFFKGFPATKSRPPNHFPLFELTTSASLISI